MEDRKVHRNIDDLIDDEISNIIQCGYQTLHTYLMEPAIEKVYENYGQCKVCKDIVSLDDTSEREYESYEEAIGDLGDFTCDKCFEAKEDGNE